MNGSGCHPSGVTETIKNEAKEQKGECLSMLLGTLDDSLLGNLLAGKGTIRAGESTIRANEGTIRAGEGTIRARKSTISAVEGTIRAGQEINAASFFTLTNFEIHKYYQKEPKFKSVYLRNNLPKIKDGTSVINLDGFESIGTH